MKQLDALRLDWARSREELAELQALLAAHPDLKESQHVLPFFRARPQLAALTGLAVPFLRRPDRIAYEYDLFGDFACDLVVGDATAKAYGFIEFEDAGPTSLFVQRGPKNTPEWSARFEHGFSQVIDWFYKRDDLEKTDDFEARFGARSIQFFGLLVVGRSAGHSARELRRLAWRQQHTLVNSRPIYCLTLDQLADNLADWLQMLPDAIPTPPPLAQG